MSAKVLHQFWSSAAASAVLLAGSTVQAALAPPNQALQPTRAKRPAR